MSRSWRKTSRLPLESLPARLLASLLKTTKRPSWLMLGLSLSPLPSAPPGPTLIRVVTAVCMSRTKMSRLPLLSPLTRSLASERKATNRPSALTEASNERALPETLPAVLTLTIFVAVAGSVLWRSRRNTSLARPSPPPPVGTSSRSVTPLTRSLARLVKATQRPSELVNGSALKSLGLPVKLGPVESALTRLVVLLWRSRTKMSVCELVSTPAGSRSLAALRKETKRPSALIDGSSLAALPTPPAVLTLISVVALVVVS